MATQSTLKEKVDVELLAEEYNETYDLLSKIEQEFHELYDEKIGEIGCMVLLKLLELTRDLEGITAQIYNSGRTIDSALKLAKRQRGEQ